MGTYQEECQEGKDPEKDTYDIRDSLEHLGGSGKVNGECKGNGAHEKGEDGVCWKRVEGRR